MARMCSPAYCQWSAQAPARSQEAMQELSRRPRQPVERCFRGEAMPEHDAVALHANHASGAERIKAIEQA